MSIVLQGSTSGSVTLQEPAVAGTTVLTLPATSGTVLVGGTQNIPKASLPAGSVLQVVNASTNTSSTISTNAYTDTGLSASITPTSATSKILVLVDQCGVTKRTGNVTNGNTLRLLRGASEIIMFQVYAGYTGIDMFNYIGSASCNYLDSPATTSPVTYKTQFRNEINGAAVTVQDNGSTSTITLMEIAA